MRKKKCPEYTLAYCENPFDASNCECKKCMNCKDLHDATIEVFAKNKSKDDLLINPEDLFKGS